MHTAQILWFLLWPVSVFITYQLVLFALKKYEAKMKGKNKQ